MFVEFCVLCNLAKGRHLMIYFNKRQSYILIFLCFLLYTTGYIGRLNYSASLVEILSKFGADKAAGGLVSSFFFFAYGAGQLVNGILSKRYNPRIVLSISLIGGAIINFLMPFAPGLSAMKWLWMVNGILQSILWSTIIRTLSIYIPDNILPKAILIMSFTVAIGTFFAYGLSAVGIAIGYWQLSFFVAAGLMTAIGIVWFFTFGYLKKQATNQTGQADEMSIKTTAPVVKEKKIVHINLYLFVFFAAIIVASIANGFIKDGTIAWTPSILYEEFNLSKSFSVILTFFLPLMSIFGAFIVVMLHKKIKSFQLLIAIFFGAAIICIILMTTVVLSQKKLVPALLLFVLISCSMAAVNNILTSVIPLYFRNKMNSGALAGIINTFCYVGSTLSAVVLGFIADSKGWTAVFITMAVFAVAAFILNIISVALSVRNKATV